MKTRINPQYQAFLNKTSQITNKTNKKYFLPPLPDKLSEDICNEINLDRKNENEQE